LTTDKYKVFDFTTIPVTWLLITTLKGLPLSNIEVVTKIENEKGWEYGVAMHTIAGNF